MTGPLAEVRRYLAADDVIAAEAVLGRLVAEVFGLEVAAVSFRRDGYSLNSANGTLSLTDGRRYFFKFHQEEGEEDALEEYYQAELLHEAGYPIDLPVHVCHQVGRQIVLYEESPYPRFADVCREADQGARAAAPLIRAQERLDDLVFERAVATLHEARAEDDAAEPIHQLFYRRLVDRPGDTEAGGRRNRFYRGATMRLPGLALAFEDFASRTWEINGLCYDRTVAELFAESRERLKPGTTTPYPAIVAHGDAHNANLWYRDDRPQPDLVYFDPAFAGRHVPALLAEVKTTFHNIFAHPDWLYHPVDADRRIAISVAEEGNLLRVTHDWRLAPLREAFLRVKAARFWKPWLSHLQARGLLPTEWRRLLRCALFCCPTLVMNLSAGQSGHSERTAALGWTIAVMLGAEPTGKADAATEFFDFVAPRRRRPNDML